MKSFKNASAMPKRKPPAPLYDTSNAGCGRRLRLLRERSGLSQEAMAARIGISGGALSRLEKGNSRISVDNALVVCREFAVTLDWIYADGRGALSDTMKKLLFGEPPPPASSAESA